MSTKCTSIQLEFAGTSRRRLLARFDGGTLTSNAGPLLLRSVEARTRVCRRAAQCFVDRRDPRRTEYPVEALVTQRVMVVALGYEDLNDHDTLRRDPLMAAVVGKADLSQDSRLRLFRLRFDPSGDSPFAARAGRLAVGPPDFRSVRNEPQGASSGGGVDRLQCGAT